MPLVFIRIYLICTVKLTIVVIIAVVDDDDDAAAS